MIPKRFHWVWLGNNRISQAHQKYILSWIYHNPGFECTIWNDKNLFPLRNQKIFNQATSYSERSDVVRYEVLHKFGGIYLDTDFECYAPISSFLNQEVLLVFEPIPKHRPTAPLGTAIIGGIPGHPLFNKCITGMPEWHIAHTGQDPAVTTGPSWLTECWKDTGLPTINDTRLFFPYCYDEKQRKRYPESVAAHHWTLSWQKQAPIPPLPPTHNLPRILF